MLSAHPPSPHLHNSHPTKASLKTWWNHFTFVQRTKKDSHFIREWEKGSETEHPVFGRPLAESLQYASVPISTANNEGELYVWGYVPVVVAKCGLYLKENATEVPGTFRVNGSNKRMRELQQCFEAPPRYGKNIDWKQETYTTHDVASVFRRYLTQMPEPVIPHRLYYKFRDVLANEPFNQESTIAEYKSLIRQMPQANQYLLLYVLDLLSVFSRKSDKNLMNAQNLAVIFRPGILSHPSHEMLPSEHALSQRVLEFLIAHQDWFMLEISAPNPSILSRDGTPMGSPRPTLDHPRYTYGPPSPAPKLPDFGFGGHAHFRSEDEKVWRGTGLPMTESEIRKEQERVKVMRRRTTLERGELGTYGVLEEGNMSVTADSLSTDAQPLPGAGAVTVARSRTLPSSKRRDGSQVAATESNPSVVTTAVPPAEKDKERSKLMKKQKSSTVAPSSQSGMQSPPQNRRISQLAVSSAHGQHGSI
ncbi:hypothetical protein AGABI1DRAFT_129873 [Agaricus bisporus var. burnettii JB137-S8]|uniref:Rho-GAP domain-containing protein n=1 Tax=Agaricus bisporus var. burnettii (strain JB137-S8 / ATCC MYA-4627 / FGSC 10392) TaxID=597362 RepID=K5X4M3_AGABU|nr:uncharacterized protein AGABI1DRAFT_129873 [Agaricus bisporus var. burnettii JB137-S8]EKM78093.1 hypothetical protein AGABI1DRAFT_129873 [Agaricus bisporus var. burnettii JB137-S8]